jgi:DNA repair photolyase
MNIEYEEYEPKSILNIHKHVDGWFWVKYSIAQYMGCQYGCEYCYWRDEKYNRLQRERPDLDDAFTQYIKVKTNTPELLRKQLKGKVKESIYVDGYQPIETKYRLAKKILQVCLDLKWPVFINEKSPLLLNDLDILKKLNKISLHVGWSIVFSEDDEKKKAFEGDAPTIASRFKAMRELSNAGIMTGVYAMPILPFICDNEENIKELVKKTRDYGGTYFMDSGLTLWGYCRTHYYKALKKYDPKLIKKYDKAFDKKGNYLNYKPTYELVKEYCKKYKIPTHAPRILNHYPKRLWDNKRIAEQMHIKAREIMMTEGWGYKQFAYTRAAWSIDELESDVKKIYKEKGKKGLLEIKGIGVKMARVIEKIIS